MTSPFAEMLANADAGSSAPAPGGATSRDSAVRAKARRTLNDESDVSTITAAHEMTFAWLRHDSNTPFGLVSCYVNGKPSALVVAAKPHHGQRTVEIMPLFVALTDGMRITAPNGEVIFENGGVA